MKLSATRQVLAVVAAASLALLTGCASGSITGEGASGTDGTNAPGIEEVSIGVFAGPVIATLQLGIDQGFFEEEGIDLTIEQAASGAAHLPALANGSLQFLLTSPITPLQASTEGLDIKIVSNYLQNDPNEPADSTVIAVGPNSELTRAKDLEGKTVSINAPGGIGELAIQDLVAKDGGDPSKVKLVTLSLGEAADQLLAGQIDAGMTGTPYLNKIVGQGGKVFLDFVKETGVGGSELVIAANGKLVSENPDLVKRFVAALAKTQEYAIAHEDELRATISELLKIPAEVVDTMVFGTPTTELDIDALTNFAQLMLDTGFTSTMPDVDSVVSVVK